MSGSAFAVTHPPSVAEQEGHLMEMEATRTARWDITPRGNTGGSGHR